MDLRLLGLTEADYAPLAPQAYVVHLSLDRDHEGLALTMRLRSVADGEGHEISCYGVSDLRLREGDATLRSAVRLLSADRSRQGWYRPRYHVVDAEEERLSFSCQVVHAQTSPSEPFQRVAEARERVRAFIDLQRTLAAAFLARYEPVDRERFRDVAPGLFFVEGHEWKQQRHGAGVSFLHAALGHVNAHVDLATHPGAIDAWRLYEWLHSIDVTHLEHDGFRYQVDARAMERLLQALEAEGMLRWVKRPGGGGWLRVLA